MDALDKQRDEIKKEILDSLIEKNPSLAHFETEWIRALNEAEKLNCLNQKIKVKTAKGWKVENK